MLVAPVLSRAEGELATCGGSAPSLKSCARPFALTGDMGVTFRLAPGLGYTGTLKARLLRKEGAQEITIATLGAYYVAGTLVPIDTKMVTEVAAVMIPAGSYRIFVEAGAPLQVCAGICTPAQAAAYTIGVGEFKAEVVPADPVA